jgi:hypothetical protein
MRKLVVLMMLGAAFAAFGASSLLACGDGGSGKPPMQPDSEHPIDGVGEGGAPAATGTPPAK